MNYQDAALKNHAYSCYLNCHNCESHPCRAPFSGCCSPWAAHSLRACPRLRKITPYERCGWMEDCTPVWMMVSAVLQTDDVWLLAPRLKSGVTQIPPYSRGWWLMAVDLHPFRGLAPIPRVGTHGCVMSPLRGSIWCVALPWVTLRSTHGCDISPLCGSMWLPCNNYALCIMNYALKKAHGCDISPLCGSKLLPYNNYELCIMNYALKKVGR